MPEEHENNDHKDEQKEQNISLMSAYLYSPELGDKLLEYKIWRSVINTFKN